MVLRVVAGQYKSRKLHDVSSKKTRPTTDRNKEALFNILGQYFDGESVLDLYAGSGALGIEARSRGAGHIVFVDHYSEAIKTIHTNVKQLALDKDIEIIKQDGLMYLKKTNHAFDIIIADPPYALMPYLDILRHIHTRHILCKGGIIVFEAEANATLPKAYETLKCYREKRFGNTKFAFYREEETT